MSRGDWSSNIRELVGYSTGDIIITNPAIGWY